MRDELRERNDTFLDFVMKGASVISIFVSLSVVIIPILLKHLPDDGTKISEENVSWITISCTVIIYILALALYFLGTTEKFRNYLMRDNLIELDELTEQLKESGDHIADRISPKENIVIESKLIKDIGQLFKKLIELRKKKAHSEQAVRLMSLSTDPVEKKYKDKKGVQKYYKDELSFCKRNPNTPVYKIFTIHSKQKLIDCKKLVKEAQHRAIPNLHLAYLNVKKFNNNLPNVIGVDIIGDSIFYMNPKYSRITNKPGWKTIYIKSQEIADIFSDYHNSLWEEIEKDPNRGLILYDGENDGISANIKTHWASIENQLHKDLNDKSDNSADEKKGSTSSIKAAFNSIKDKIEAKGKDARDNSIAS